MDFGFGSDRVEAIPLLDPTIKDYVKMILSK